MKMTIEWHENCLKNMIYYANRQQSTINSMIAEQKRLCDSIKLKEKQIEIAKQKGMNEFDGNKLKVKL